MTTALWLIGLLALLVADLWCLRWLLRRWDGFHITITTVKSPDWEGDAQRWRDTHNGGKNP